VADPEDTAEICNRGDIVCDFNASRIVHFKGGSAVHTSYLAKHSELLNKAVDWLDTLL